MAAHEWRRGLCQRGVHGPLFISVMRGLASACAQSYGDNGNNMCTHFKDSVSARASVGGGGGAFRHSRRFRAVYMQFISTVLGVCVRECVHNVTVC